MKTYTFLQALKKSRKNIEEITHKRYHNGSGSIYICDNLELYGDFRREFRELSQFDGYSISQELTGVRNTYDLTEEQFNHCKLVRLILLDLLIESLKK